MDVTAGRCAVGRRAAAPLALAWLGLALVLGVALAPRPASAHATLIASRPLPGERLRTAPGVVVLTFSQTLNTRLSRADVTAPGGQRFEESSVSESEIRVPLTTNAPGVYDVRWTSVSAVDGHILSGDLLFGVGVSPGATATEDEALPGSGDLALAALRGLEYLCLLLATGLLLLRELARRRPALAWVRTPLPPVLAAALLAGASVVAAEALTAAPGLGRDAFAGYLLAGPAGWSRLARVCLEGAAVALSLRWPRLSTAPLGAALVFLAVGGHAAAAQPPWLGVAATTLHLGSAGLWAGGIVALALQRPPGGWLASRNRGVPAGRVPRDVGLEGGFPPQNRGVPAARVPRDDGLEGGSPPQNRGVPAARVPRDDGLEGGSPPQNRGVPAARVPRDVGLEGGFPPQNEGRRLLARFTPVALVAFPITAATGVLEGTEELSSLRDVVVTTYGQVLGLKVGAVALMLPLSVLAWRRLAPSPRLEAALAVVVVGASALLAAFPLPPARQSEAAAVEAGPRSDLALPREGDLTMASSAGDVLVGLTLRPGLPGRNTAWLYVLPLHGEQGAAGLAVTVGPAGRGEAARLCGPACREAVVDLRGGETLTVGVRGGGGGGRAAFQVPRLPAADGHALLGAAQARMHALRTYRVDETLRPARTPLAVTYAFQAPDRMSYQVGGGGASVIIGQTQYLRDSDSGPWRAQAIPPIHVPSFVWDGSPAVAVRALGSAQSAGQQLQRLSFFEDQDQVPVWFELRVDGQGQVEEAEMRAQGHFMDDRYIDFDGALSLVPPTR